MTAPAAAPAGPLPWTPPAVALAVGGNGLGLVLVLAAWYVGGGQARADDVAVWANLSVCGLVLAATGNAVLLTSARARVGERHRELARSRAARVSAAVAATPAPVAAAGRLVGLPGQTLVHREACALVAGKPAVDLDAAEAELRDPCGWCRP